MAAAGSTREGMGYVGVWAEDAAGCATVDQPNPARYVVITSATIRSNDHACYANNKPLVDGKQTLTFSCPAVPDSKPASVEISMPSPDTLIFNGSPPLVRCKL